MAVTDLTNTPIDLITSDAVSRGIHTTTIKIDFLLNTTKDAATHLIYEMPAGAALLPGSAGYITTAITGTLASNTITFAYGGSAIGAARTGDALGTGFALGPENTAAGNAGMYQAAAADITMINSHAATAGVIVLVLVWADIGNALSAGYREGDGTV